MNNTKSWQWTKLQYRGSNGTKELSLKILNKIGMLKKKTKRNILYLDKTWQYHYDSHRC